MPLLLTLSRSSYNLHHPPFSWAENPGVLISLVTFVIVLFLSRYQCCWSLATVHVHTKF
jgi:hypothetical protein